MISFDRSCPRSTVKPAIRLGLAIWAYRPWVGDFYPPKTPAREFLPCYGRQLRTVEGNATFYAVPSSKTLAQWRDRVPAGFHFCPKFPQSISHQGALLPHIPAAIEFIEHLQRYLGDRLGPLLLQLPPSYGPARFTELSGFLQALIAQCNERLALALEVRHPDWFANPARDRLRAFLQSHQIGRVLLDTRPVYRCPDDPQAIGNRRKPDLPVQPTITAEFGIVRLISHPDPERNQSYWQYWCDRLLTWQTQRKTVYVFIHCPDERRSPANLRAFSTQLQQCGLTVDFTPIAPTLPAQLSIFDL